MRKFKRKFLTFALAVMMLVSNVQPAILSAAETVEYIGNEEVIEYIQPEESESIEIIESEPTDTQEEIVERVEEPGIAEQREYGPAVESPDSEIIEVEPELGESDQTEDTQDDLIDEIPIEDLLEDVEIEIAAEEDLLEVKIDPAEPLLQTAELMDETIQLVTAAAPAKVAPGETTGTVSGDGISFDKLTIRWASKSTGDTEAAKMDPLVLVPTTDVMPNQQFQIDLTISGSGFITPGDIELVFPACIWKTRAGKEPNVI